MFSLWVWFQIIAIGLIWLPLVLNKIFPEHPWNSLGGITGNQLNIWFTEYLGPVGLILLIILVPTIFILIDFRISFSKLKIFKKKDDQIENEINDGKGRYL